MSFFETRDHSHEAVNYDLALILTLLIVVAGAVWCGFYFYGQHQAAQARDSLEAVWPGLMDMPERDRAVIVGLAYTCKLKGNTGHDRAANRARIVQCLHDAGGDPNALLPNGVTREQAARTLDRLLSEAQ